MSNNPFSAPQNYSTPNPGMPMGRQPFPVLGIVLVILAFIFGGLNLFGGCCGLLGFAGFSAMANSDAFNKALSDAAAKGDEDAKQAIRNLEQAKEQMSGNMIPAAIQLVLGCVLGIGLIVGGIGTLMRKEWGRNLLVLSCLGGVAITVIGFAISFATGNFGQDAAQAPAGMEGVAKGVFVFTILLSILYVGYYLFTWRYFSSEERRSLFS